jgi:methionyl-tRNA synthetase
MTIPDRLTFVATAIPYVNAAPHLGFAFEVVLADVVARHARLRCGDPVVLATGTDDHALKNVLAAEAAGEPTADFVASHADAFRRLWPALEARHDAWVSTSSDPRHREVVARLWAACLAAGDLRRGTYRGLYCGGCEAFFEPGDLVDGRCAEHPHAALETVEEDNWFFDLGRHQGALVRWLSSSDVVIEPPAARAEALAFVRGELREISVSRSQRRARGWGIPVPGDPSQAIYVWFDALAYYLTTGAWHEAQERVHVIGRGIARFHAVFWPAFLFSAGLPLPTRILVHGYVTESGAKLSKSSRGLDPVPLVEALGSDAVRWYLLRGLHTTRGGDARPDEIAHVHDADLANAIGNLESRLLRLAELLGATGEGGSGPLRPEDVALADAAQALPGRIDDAFARFAIDEAAASLVHLADTTNRYLATTAPWSLARGDASARARGVDVVERALAALRVIVRELAPFLPGASERLRAAIEARPLASGAPAFPRRIPPTRAASLVGSRGSDR